MADKPKNEIDELKHELETLRADFAQVMDSMKRATGAQAQAGVDAARDSADKLRGHARDAAESLESEIQARPYTSVLTAFGVGFVLGKLLDR